MHRILPLVLLAGCATPNDEIAMKVLGNLEHCERHYTLALGVGASGSMVINCPAMPYPDAPPK